MANRILLFVSTVQVLAAHWRGNAMAACQTFVPDEAGLEAFGAFVADAQGVPAYVVADTVEEDYRYETLPHATGADRNSLLERKFHQYYRNTRFATALPRGRTSDRRRDDRYLFAALTNPALVQPWLDVLASHGVPLAGVYLSPLLTAGILARLNVKAPRVLVVAPHRAGLRLTFYKDGEFCTSRLTRAIPHDAQEAQSVLSAELSNTRLYLSTLHLDSADESLNVLLLDAGDRLAPAAAHIAAAALGLDCTCVDRATLIERLSVSAAQLDVAPETLYLPALATTVPQANLAPATLTAGYQQIRRRRALYAASAALGLAGVLWTGYNLWQARDFEHETQRAAQATAAAQAQYREITRTFPATPTGSDNLIKAVEVYQQVIKSARSPLPYMRTVSRAMADTPLVYLQELAWNHGVAATQSAGAEVATAAAPRPATGSRQTGTLSAEIRPFYGDYRAAIATINTFAERLAREPGVASIKVIKLPLNVNPELSLAGNTREAADQGGNAEFKLEISLEPDA